MTKDTWEETFRVLSDEKLVEEVSRIMKVKFCMAINNSKADEFSPIIIIRWPPCNLVYSGKKS